MVYSFVLVAPVSRRRSRSGRVKGMPIVGLLRRVWIPLTDINKFDADSGPQQVDGASLSWSLKIFATGSAVADDIVPERISNQGNARTDCRVKGA